MITEDKEVKFWKFLKGKLANQGVDMQRIENTTGGGVPDVNMCHQSRDAWIELKVYVKGNVLLRKEQYAWLVRRARSGGNVMVMAHNTENDRVEFFMPPFKVRPFGKAGKYVAIIGDCEASYSKHDPVKTYLRIIFD